VVRAAAQAAVVVAQDERLRLLAGSALRLLAGSALGRRTDESKQSAAGVDDPRRHDQSLSSVPVPAADSWKHNGLKRLRGHSSSSQLHIMRASA